MKGKTTMTIQTTEFDNEMKALIKVTNPSLRGLQSRGNS